MPESDEALLRRAAVLARQRGKAATQGPWSWQTMWCDRQPDEPHHPNCDGTDTLAHWPVEALMHESNVLKVPHDSWPPNPDDAAWIALVGPQLAEPLAAWLEAEADSCARLAGWSSINGHAHLIRAVRFARALLGEPALTAPVGDDPEEEK